MKTIYINANNENNQIYPFDTEETAASSFDVIRSSFLTLPEFTNYIIVKLTTFECSEIYLPRGCVLTSQTGIQYDQYPIVRLNTITLSEGCEISKLKFNIVLNDDFTRIIVFSNSCKINNCNITFIIGAYYTVEKVLMLIENCNYVSIDSNYIEIPEQFNGDAITSFDSKNIKIINNKIKHDKYGNVIYINGSITYDYPTSYNIKIMNNVIIAKEVSYVNIISIYESNNVTIFNNVVKSLISESNTAINIYCTKFGENVIIKNNYIHLDASKDNVIGIYVKFDENNTNSSYEITNNIVYNYGNITNAGSYAYNVSIFKDVFDYNCSYNFNNSNVFVYDNYLGVIDSFGVNSIFNLTPDILINDNSQLDELDINSYLSNNEKFRSTGIDGLNVGVIGTLKKYDYYNLIDNVLINNIINVQQDLSNSSIVVKNNAQTQNLLNISNVNHFSYGNQDNWVYLDLHEYPFSKDSALYDTDLNNIIINKNLLEPFDGIIKPPNPGSGFPNYNNYEYGLFKSDRNNYTT